MCCRELRKSGISRNPKAFLEMPWQLRKKTGISGNALAIEEKTGISGNAEAIEEICDLFKTALILENCTQLNSKL